MAMGPLFYSRLKWALKVLSCSHCKAEGDDFTVRMQAEVPVAFASDWPVVAIEPLLGMYTAVHRRSPGMAAHQAWSPSGAVGVEDALHAHTAGAAFACGLEHQIGSLK